MPLRREKNDLLDRWRVAKRVHDTITNAPSDWSMRIGIHAGWGEGKTTVMRFVESLARAEGDFTVWYSPWAESWVEALREEFAKELVDDLEAQKAPAAAVEVVRRKLLLKKWGGKLKTASEANPVSKATTTVVGQFLDGTTTIGTEDLAAIVSHLGKRRVIVFIDDLDGTDPALLPKLLLSLREVLDIPSFVFVLGFDEKSLGNLSEAIIGHGEAERHSWIRFWIFAFRFRLPPTSKSDDCCSPRCSSTARLFRNRNFRRSSM